MNNSKKLLSLFVAIAMLLTFVAPMYAAGGEEKTAVTQADKDTTLNEIERFESVPQVYFSEIQLKKFAELIDKAETKKDLDNIKASAKELFDYIFEIFYEDESLSDLTYEQMDEILKNVSVALTKHDAQRAVLKITNNELYEFQEATKEEINKLDLYANQKENFNELVEESKAIEEVNKIVEDAKELLDYIVDAKMSDEARELTDEQWENLDNVLSEALTKEEAEEKVNKYFNKIKQPVDPKEDDKKDSDEPEKNEPDKEAAEKAAAEELAKAKEAAKEAINKLDLSQVQKDNFKKQVDEAKTKEEIEEVKKAAQDLYDYLLEIKVGSDDKRLQELTEEEKYELSTKLDEALTKEEAEKAVDELFAAKEAKEAEEKAKEAAEKAEAEEIAKAKEAAKEEINKLDLYANQKENFNELVEESKAIEEVNKIVEDAKELLDYIVDAKMSDEARELTDEQWENLDNVLSEALTKEEAEEKVNKYFNKIKQPVDPKEDDKKDSDEPEKNEPDKEAAEKAAAEELAKAKEAAKEAINKLDLSQVQKDNFKKQVDEAKTKEEIEEVKKAAQDLYDYLLEIKVGSDDKRLQELTEEEKQELSGKLDEALTKEEAEKVVNEYLKNLGKDEKSDDEPEKEEPEKEEQDKEESEKDKPGTDEPGDKPGTDEPGEDPYEPSYPSYPGYRYEPSPDYLRDYSKKDDYKPAERNEDKKDEVKEEEREEVLRTLYFYLDKGFYEMEVNGEIQQIPMDVAPTAINQRTMLPIRFVAEAIGATVEWHQDTQSATFTKDGITATITLGSNIIQVSDGRQIVMDAEPTVISERIFVPLTNISQIFGMTNGDLRDGVYNDIEWDQENYRVIITVRENQ